MNTNLPDYDLFYKFIEAYSPTGFTGIKRDDPLILELEEFMEKSDQFFLVADIIQIKILFTSKRSSQMIGIEPEEVSPYHFFEATHAGDIQRHSVERAYLFKLAQDLFISQDGEAILSTNFRIRNGAGDYDNTLIQCYLFNSQIPYKTVYILQILTNISWSNKINHGFHYYTGKDLAYFRYPDKKLLNQGNMFTEREFQIIELIASGQSSEQIAAKLFLSLHTVNTHRRNILTKSGKTNISELIFELKGSGML